MTTDALEVISDSNIQIGKFKLAKTGLVVTGAPTYEEWQACGEFLTQAEKAIQFWIGDWIRYGEGRYGETYAQAIEQTGLDYQTLADAKWVASKVEFSRRRENLSFSHHREVAPLDPDSQDKLLDDAENQGMDRGKFREHVRRHKQAALAPAKRAAAGSLRLDLYQGDAFDWIETLEDGTVDLLLTDPPYNVTDNPWDRIGTDDEYMGWLSNLLMALKPKLKPDFHFFMFCAPRYQARIELLLTGLGWPLKSRIVWSHRNMSMGRDVADKFIENWEMAFHCGSHPLNWPIEWNDERFQVQEHAVPQTNFTDTKLHPTSKPIKLIELFVKVGSQEGDLVLDPFAGGGTTGEACQRQKRSCILIEKSAEYCGVIADRLGVTPCLE